MIFVEYHVSSVRKAIIVDNVNLHIINFLWMCGNVGVVYSVESHYFQ